MLQSVRSILPKFAFDEKKLGQWNYSSIVEEVQKDAKKQAFAKVINAENPMARSQLARLCGISLPTLSKIVERLAATPESAENQQTMVIFSKVLSSDELVFVDCLKYLIHDPELAVFFEAVIQATSKSFALMLESYPKENAKPDPKAQQRPDMKQNVTIVLVHDTF